MINIKNKFIGIFISIFFCAEILTADTTLIDNFDTGLKNWDKPENRFIKIADGQMANKTPCPSWIALKNKNLGSFELSFKLKFIGGREKEAGHFSITTDRTYGKWLLYFTSNDKNSQITSHFIPIGAPSTSKRLFNEVIKLPLPIEKWLNVKLVCNDRLYQLQVGEQKFILGTAPGKGGIVFGSYRQPFAIKDFKLSYSEPGTEALSPNLIINGSFEYASNPDIPDCWAGNGVRYRTNGLPIEMCTEESIKEFHDKFFPDDKNAFHGKQSICIESPFFLLSQPVKIKKNEPYTASCYIKADADSHKIKIGLTSGAIEKPLCEKIIEADKDWKRFEITLNKSQKENCSFFAKPLSSGKIWVDAVQVEPGTKASPFRESWFDGGFALPDYVNKNQCSNNYRAVQYNLRPKNIVSNTDLKISNLKLTSENPLKHAYDLKMDIINDTEVNKKFHITACITSKRLSSQMKSRAIEIQAKKSVKLDFKNFILEDLRACVNILIADEDGKTIKNTRQFIDVPQPMRIYTEYSYYTKEKEARVVIQFGAPTENFKNAKLNLDIFVSGYLQYPRSKTSVALNPVNERQIVSMSLKRLRAEKKYTVRAQVINPNGNKVMEAETELIMQNEGNANVKINRINRGVYLNGKPFLPYGILVSSFGEEQLKYYKKCGFSFIQFISHWNKPEKNMEFLETCKKYGINAIAFHVARPYSLDPSEAAKLYRSSPALVGIIPNDESANRIVYDRTAKTKLASPNILLWVNHHFHSYIAFANRIDGFPGDVLSIDRYPFILQPPGRPQTTSDIYSFELSLEMMDKDGKRERKPVFCWLQAGERFSKEPTPEQLTWQTYIALANHCMGFTYFGGIPNSKIVWDKMIELNKEIETLKSPLFSLEEEPPVSLESKASENIRVLAKKLKNELTIICVNRTLFPINASLDLSKAGIKGQRAVEVLFENRNLQTDETGKLKDNFKPLERHVYRLKIK